MPRHKDLKRIIRARMQKTGEAYTVARAHIVDNPANMKHAAHADAPASPDYAARTGRRNEIMVERTGRDWGFQECTQQQVRRRASPVSP